MRASFWVFATLLACASAAGCRDKKLVCYWGSWSIYRKENGTFDTTNIDPTLCTHLNYAFAVLSDNNTIQVADPVADLPDNGGNNGYRLFNQLRQKNPELKTLISVGGWNDGSVKYSKMVSSATTRKTFVESCVAFIKKYGFNGMDLDWEYPYQRDGVEADRENFVLLLKELKEHFEKEGFILTAAVGAGISIVKQSYIIPEVSKYLDFINLMTYDFHVSSENKTGLNAPLYAGSWERGEERLLNINTSVNFWISQGAPREKIVLGMPFYGHSFTLADINQKQVGAPAKSPGLPGPYTQAAGSLGYNEICEMFKREEWDVRRDKQQRTPYAVRNDQWVGYDNPRSLREKAQLIENLGLAGGMVWSIETDDFRGSCGPKNILLRTLNDILRRCDN